MATAGAYDGGIQPKADKDPTKQIQWQIQKAIAGLWDGIIGAIEAAVNAVKEWVMGLFGFIGDIVDFINPGEIIERILQALTGMSTVEVIDLLINNPIGFLPQILFNFIKNGLLGKNSPLNAFNIFGLLQSWNLPFLSIGALTNKMPNLLVQPGFTLEDSIDQATNGWTWDPDDGRTDPGCARVDVIGSIQQILQTVPIPAAEGQKIKSHIWVKWQGLTYTGSNPIAVDLVRLDENGIEISKTTLKTIVNPAASSGGNWFQIDCPEYEIPVGNTAQILWQLRAPENATGGSIWWDDAELKKVNTSIPQNWILNLVPDLGGIRNWIQDVIDAVISGIRGIPFVGGTLAALILDLTGWREDTDDAASQAADAYIGLGVTQKIITAASTNTPLDPAVITTPQDEEVKAALEAQTQVIVSQSAYIEQVNTKAISELNAGVRVLDPVETVHVGELDPAKWQEYTLEGLPDDAWLESSDGANISMGWTGSGNNTKAYRWIGEGAHTLTNRQKVTATIAKGLKYPFTDGRRPHHAVYCRWSDDGTKWVRAYVTNANALIVDYRNGAASGVLLNTGQDWKANPPAGSSLSIEPGFGTNDRIFRVFFGNTPVALVEDTGLVTDITPKGHGIGMRVASGFGPGAFTQYTAVDNAPAPVPGTHLHVARLLTSQSTINEGADINVFSASPVKQNNIDWNGTVATIKQSDTYTIVVRIKHQSFISNSNQDACIIGIKVDGVVQPLGPSLANGIGGLVGQTPYIMRINALYATFTLPLNAGQVVQPFLYSNNNTSFPCVGDADGILSYMMITRT